MLFKLLVICMFTFLSGEETKVLFPAGRLAAEGMVTDFVVEKDLLYAATYQGTMEVFSLGRMKRISITELPLIKDFTGSQVPPKVFSIDKYPGWDKILLVSQGKSGFRNIDIYIEGKPTRIISDLEHKAMVKRAVFAGENHIIYGTIGNEIVIYDLLEKKEIYKTQVSQSTLSQYTYDRKYERLTIADEGGKIHIIELNNDYKIIEVKSKHLDNVLSVDSKNNVVIGGGKDRRVSVYNLVSGNLDEIRIDFHVYCVGLNTEGTMGAYTLNDDGDIVIFYTETIQRLFILEGQSSLPTRIYFYNDQKVISSGEGSFILFWNLK